MNCTICNSPVEHARVDLGLNTCYQCASKHVRKYKGDMHFHHKTAPVLMLMSHDTHANYRRYVPYGKYTGRGSGTHKMSRPVVTLK